MTLAKIVKFGVGALTVPVLIIGSLILYEGLHDYFSDEPSIDDARFGDALLGVTIVGFPLSVYFGYKTSQSSKLHSSTYDQPDSPLEFLSLVIITSGLALITFLSMALYIVFITH